MYIRLSEERERKLRRLTKSIVSAHSKKPKGVCCTLNVIVTESESLYVDQCQNGEIHSKYVKFYI